MKCRHGGKYDEFWNNCQDFVALHVRRMVEKARDEIQWTPKDPETIKEALVWDKIVGKDRPKVPGEDSDSDND
jgi:hypothetical protein